MSATLISEKVSEGQAMTELYFQKTQAKFFPGWEPVRVSPMFGGVSDAAVSAVMAYGDSLNLQYAPLSDRVLPERMVQELGLGYARGSRICGFYIPDLCHYCGQFRSKSKGKHSCDGCGAPL